MIEAIAIATLVVSSTLVPACRTDPPAARATPESQTAAAAERLKQVTLIVSGMR